MLTFFVQQKTLHHFCSSKEQRLKINLQLHTKKNWYQPTLKDKNKCRDCHIIMTSCMTSPWHHHDIIHDITMTSSWHHPWHHVVPPHDIIMTSSMTSSRHLSSSTNMHLTSGLYKCTKRKYITHPMYIYTYLFYTCILH